jgi:hypothetical protein
MPIDASWKIIYRNDVVEWLLTLGDGIFENLLLKWQNIGSIPIANTVLAVAKRSDRYFPHFSRSTSEYGRDRTQNRPRSCRLNWGSLGIADRDGLRV